MKTLAAFTLCLCAVAIPAFPSSNISRPLSTDSNRLGCLKRGKLTTVDGCRPLLTRLTTYPDYNIPQYFEEHKSPKYPRVPPFGLIVKGATCTLQIGCSGRSAMDKFSWRDVRAVATDIVEDCQPPKGEGKGGTNIVGPKGIWVIAVLGRDPNDPDTILDYGGMLDGDDAYFYPLSDSPMDLLTDLGEDSSSAVDAVQTT